MFTLKPSSALSLLFLLPLAGVACGGASPSAKQPSDAHSSAATSVRLYALDCGRVEIKDLGFFSETGQPIGKPVTMVTPCFLIRHPKGTLLWDTGLKTEIAKEGLANPAGTEFVDVSVRDELGTLSLTPNDITYVGFSHLHADHAGNADLFTSSTWLLSRRELESGLTTPPPLGVEPARFSKYRDVKIDLLDADKDVFGDGSVRILQTPGHTPGHQSLVIRLEHAGTIVLSGDLAHTRENWANHKVPFFNASREQTLASMKRVDAILAETHGKFIVQHSAEDFQSLPKFPAYLD